MTDLDELTGRVAVVTGGASGIGAAVVNRLRDRGSLVEIADLSLGLDVTDADAVNDFADQIRASYGRCDILVNCAGTLAAGTVLEVTEADWDKAFATNVRGPWLMSRAFLPMMPEGSAIVHVSSGAGLRAVPAMAAYVASKAALVGLTSAMAIDHAPQGIRVNCVCPGLVDTPMNQRAQRDRPVEIRDQVASFAGYLLPRHGLAEEVAAAIVFLASPAAGYMTGATVAVDGGRTLH